MDRQDFVTIITILSIIFSLFNFLEVYVFKHLIFENETTKEKLKNKNIDYEFICKILNIKLNNNIKNNTSYNFIQKRYLFGSTGKLISNIGLQNIVVGAAGLAISVGTLYVADRANTIGEGQLIEQKETNFIADRANVLKEVEFKRGDRYSFSY